MQRLSKILMAMMLACQPIVALAQEQSRSVLKWSSSALGHGLLHGYVEDETATDTETKNSTHFHNVRILEETSKVFGNEGDYFHLITIIVGNDKNDKTKIMMKFPSATKEFGGEVDLVMPGEWQLVDQGQSDFEGPGYGSVTAYIPAGKGKYMYELTDVPSRKLKASLQ